MHDSPLGRPVSVLAAPRRTFESIAQRPSWFIPVLVLMMLSAVVFLLASQKIDYAELMPTQGQAGMDPDQMKGFFVGCGVAGAVLGQPLFIVVAAALFLLGFRLTGGELDFRGSLAVTAHGLMPIAVSALLSIPVILARESLDAERLQQGGGVLMSNLESLAPEGAAPPLVALLSSLDIFSVWSVVLLVLGFETVARVSRGNATAVVVTLWLLGIAVKMALSLLQGLG